MTYFRVINNPNRLRFLENHFGIKRELIPFEILSLSDVKSIIPSDRKSMSCYVAQMVGDTIKTTTKNIQTIDGHKYLIDSDFINDKVTEQEIKRGK